jgi:hypothetical protein
MGSPILEEKNKTKSHTLNLWVSNANRPSGRRAGRWRPCVQVTLVGCLSSSMESNDNVERSQPIKPINPAGRTKFDHRTRTRR